MRWFRYVPGVNTNTVPAGFAFTALWMLCPALSVTVGPAGTDGVLPPPAVAESRTVSVALPVTPEADAETEPVPTPFASASPLLEIVTTEVGALLHVTVTFGITVPFASLTTAVACVISPMRSVGAFVVTLMERGTSTGADTLTVALPDLPSAVAVIAAEPALIAVTRPSALTVATVASAVVHETVRPVSTLEASSLSTALACVLCPTVSVLEPSVAVMEATGAGVGAAGVESAAVTGGVTVIVAAARLFSETAVIFAVPALIGVRAPVELTTTTAALFVLHATLRFVSVLPDASLTVAVSCATCPTATLSGEGLMVTDATVWGFTCTRTMDALPSTVSRTSAAPSALPVIVAALVTAAIWGAEEVHSTTCVERSTALPSLSMAR